MTATVPGRFVPAAVLLLGMGCAASLLGGDQPREQDSRPPMRMETAVVCKEIRGFGDYDPLPGASLTRDEKLLVYSEPTGYTIQPDKDKKSFKAHLTSDGRVRKKGRKEILFERKTLLDFTFNSSTPQMVLCLRTNVAIKSLGPGDYELDLVVKDALAVDRFTSRTVAFTVLPNKPNAVKPEAQPDEVERKVETPAKPKQK